MLDSLKLPLRNECLSALCEICGRQTLLPRSLPQIPLCYDKSGAPLYTSGFANVWMGEYQGRKVAVKVLSVYLPKGLNQITEVGHHQKLAKSV